MSQIRFRLHITSPLPADLGHIPMAPEIDFAALMAAAGATGVLDPNSIEIRGRHSGGLVEYALGEDLLYGAQGRIEWVITDPACRTYDISFRTVERRPPLAVRHRVPQIGVGDLRRYNAGVPRPIVLHGAARLVDLTGDGGADLVGCWNYYHRPGWPISGVVCYPRAAADFCFGEMIRLRYVEARGAEELLHFPGTYVCVDVADVDGDGLVDLVFAEQGSGAVRFFLNTGERDEGGWPIFVRDAAVEVQKYWHAATARVRGTAVFSGGRLYRFACHTGRFGAGW